MIKPGIIAIESQMVPGSFDYTYWQINKKFANVYLHCEIKVDLTIKGLGTIPSMIR